MVIIVFGREVMGGAVFARTCTNHVLRVAIIHPKQGSIILGHGRPGSMAQARISTLLNHSPANAIHAATKSIFALLPPSTRDGPITSLADIHNLQ